MKGLLFGSTHYMSIYYTIMYAMSRNMTQVTRVQNGAGVRSLKPIDG